MLSEHVHRFARVMHLSRSRSVLSTALCLLTAAFAVTPLPGTAADDAYYSGEQVYGLRPRVDRGRAFGHIGPTGMIAHINRGVQVTVEQIAEGSPAEGKIEEGDVIRGVNGTALKGLNPYVVLGRAITEAEATDGKLVFEVQRGDGSQQVSLTIPVLGRYSATWPVNCPKSDRIVKEAAAFYHDALGREKGHGIPGALMSLFLLSTGDDSHLPVVKGYLAQFLDDVKKVGGHTWNNGYNGVACAEYYLRTGDKDVLPLLQYYCDDAARRQKFGVAWPHWGDGINPRYVSGGLMNPASAQVLTTLLLAKECGVDVDDATLLGSLKFFYRFVGHGTVPYGDHRSEGGLGSNGKDGMISAAMQVAAGAGGDTAIYETARDYLSMSMIKSYPSLATGHGDSGRGDGLWRGLSAAFLREKKPQDYRGMMDRLTWWFDLSRFHNGGLGMATVGGFCDKPGSGAGLALTYTAHLKNLRIAGAPRSDHAVEFTLPEHLWGRPADRAFHSNEHNPKFHEYGEEMPPHKIINLLGTAYKNVDPSTNGVTREQMLQNIYHHRYMVRAQAAKALFKTGRLDDIERLLADPDPRVRRAALDGLLDWKYFFNMGKNPIKPEQFSPGMIDAVVKMISDPDEALLVVEGALFVISRMPADAIYKNLDAIRVWTSHEEWWLRHASFMALQGLSRDEDKERYLEVLPTLMEMMVTEYHTQPREIMNGALKKTLGEVGADSRAGEMILAAFTKAADTSEIKPGLRQREGLWNVLNSTWAAIDKAPEAALPIARRLRDRLDKFDDESLIHLLATSESTRFGRKKGLYSVLEDLEPAKRKELAGILHEDYLPELIKRLKAADGSPLGLIDTIVPLRRLKEDVDGWQVVGKPAPDKRAWHYVSLDPATESEQMVLRERKRFRQITLPDHLKGWVEPEFDPSGWKTGFAPIGTGKFMRGGENYESRSDWGEGEFLLARTTFEVDKLDYDLYRLRILNNQGFHIYLNGKRINSYVWWNDKPRYWKRPMSKQQVGLLRKGKNTLAIYANLEYPSAMKPHWKQERFGQVDCYIEGLRKSDLY